MQSSVSTLFAGYLISTFPYSATLSKILAPMGLVVSSSGQSASFPFGARLADVRLTSTRPANAGLILESPAVTIAPALLSMLTLHPGVRVKAALFDGSIKATIGPGDGGIAISYDLDSIDIARQHLFAIPGADAAGRLSGSGSLLLSYADIAQSGDGDLSAAGLTVISPLATAPIRLGEGHSKFKLDQGTLTIEEFTTSGGDLTLDRYGHNSTRPRPRPKRTGGPVHARDDSRRRAPARDAARRAAASTRPAALSPDRHPKRPTNQIRGLRRPRPAILYQSTISLRTDFEDHVSGLKRQSAICLAKM